MFPNEDERELLPGSFSALAASLRLSSFFTKNHTSMPRIIAPATPPTTPPATTAAFGPEEPLPLDGELPEPAADEPVDEAEDPDEVAVADALSAPEEVAVPVAVVSDAVVTPTVSVLVPVDLDVVAVDVTELVAGCLLWSASISQLPALLHE